MGQTPLPTQRPFPEVGKGQSSPWCVVLVPWVSCEVRTVHVMTPSVCLSCTPASSQRARTIMTSPINCHISMVCSSPQVLWAQVDWKSRVVGSGWLGTGRSSWSQLGPLSAWVCPSRVPGGGGPPVTSFSWSLFTDCCVVVFQLWTKQNPALEKVTF